MDLCKRWSVKLITNRLACDDVYHGNSEYIPRGTPPDLPLLETNDTLPKGNYQFFCRQCVQTNDDQLKCSCKIDDWFSSFWYDISLPLNTCKTLDNINYARGYLLCNSQNMFRFLGSFADSCEPCSLEGTSLKCRCRKSLCGWSRKDKEQSLHRSISTLSDFRFCTEEIINL